jgi:cyclase
MEILRIDASISAVIRPEVGANVGLVQTPEGMILIDTTSSPAEIKALINAVGVGVDDVKLVINTHSHNDHTWGNQVFTCTILAHHLCQEQMQLSLKNEWSSETLQSYLTDLEKTDPRKAEDLGKVVESLQVRLPDRVFEERFEGVLGGVRYEVIHFGGHTPDSSIVWLPEKKVLFASDLIFQGRYPYIFDADIPAWIGALNRLLEIEADMTIPGHGVRCGEAEIIRLREYLQNTWELTEEHIRVGHSMEQTSADPAYPIFPGEKYERLHQANICYMYNKLTE